MCISTNYINSISVFHNYLQIADHAIRTETFFSRLDIPIWVYSVFLSFHNRYVEAQSENAALENKLTKLQEAQSENIVLENKLTKLKADQALWQDIFVKNTELENDLKKEKDWRSQLQASKESADDNVSQLSKELLFYKKVADVSSANLANKKKTRMQRIYIWNPFVTWFSI